MCCSCSSGPVTAEPARVAALLSRSESCVEKGESLLKTQGFLTVAA